MHESLKTLLSELLELDIQEHILCPEVHEILKGIHRVLFSGCDFKDTETGKWSLNHGIDEMLDRFNVLFLEMLDLLGETNGNTSELHKKVHALLEICNFCTEHLEAFTD